MVGWGSALALVWASGRRVRVTSAAAAVSTTAAAATAWATTSTLKVVRLLLLLLLLLLPLFPRLRLPVSPGLALLGTGARLARLVPMGAAVAFLACLAGGVEKPLHLLLLAEEGADGPDGVRPGGVGPKKNTCLLQAVDLGLDLPDVRVIPLYIGAEEVRRYVRKGVRLGVPCGRGQQVGQAVVHVLEGVHLRAVGQRKSVLRHRHPLHESGDIPGSPGQGTTKVRIDRPPDLGLVLLEGDQASQDRRHVGARGCWGSTSRWGHSSRVGRGRTGRGVLHRPGGGGDRFGGLAVRLGQVIQHHGDLRQLLVRLGLGVV